MVSVVHEGEVYDVEEHTSRTDSGVANKSVTKIRDTKEVRVSVHYLEGHPNLDAFIHTISPGTPFERATAHDDSGKLVDCEPVDDTWETTVHGETHEWVQSALAILSERPDDTLDRIIKLFVEAENFNCSEYVRKTVAHSNPDHRRSEFEDREDWKMYVASWEEALDCQMRL